ncbi:HNH endonuclease signature motif containing protein [Nocardioides sp. B-3]|uniref:HNH endonuclease signature motif containing protein n=1 Tax=Nocardioides sp. B-3 TaxID=2895565 RepID=UPI0021538AA7|nr:HNH endonuclease signature motif containing protein [Nocardioides sp. B-3]UUZ58118.1 HNH endonuclease [Nocardioides sp. B-3]
MKPVIDLRERLATAGYVPTERIRDHVIARDRTCVFPWCGRNARLCDPDHVVPFDHDAPDRGGTTSTDNLAALCRRHHRLKTKGRWRYEMTEPGRVRLDQPPRTPLPPRPHRITTHRRDRSPARPLTTPPHTPQGLDSLHRRDPAGSLARPDSPTRVRLA